MSDYTKARRRNTAFRGTACPRPRCRFTLIPEASVTEKVGETVRDNANYRCERCHKVTHVSKGALIQPCPQCGYDTFDIANPRFERGDGSLGPHEPG
jgi:hypothetical protein